ncbi:unnamed protein product, partial [Symbiodinium microadriaticum]
MNPDSLRYYTRKFRPPQELARKATDRKQQPCIAEVSRSEWEAFVSQHSDGTGLLQIVHTLPSGSFVGFLPPMLQELKSLHLQGRMAEIYLAADATFDVEADGFKYHVFTAAVYRVLSGIVGGEQQDRWRRSALPLAIARHPTERPEVYGHVFSALHTELQRLGLPAAQQVHSDWMPGLPAAIRQNMPGARHVQDLEHMLKNLAKSSVKTVTGEEIRVPRLCTRPLRVVASYIHTIALLPSVSLFLVCLGTLLDRIKTGWGEEPFHDFFVQQYLYKASIQEAVYGVSEVLTGRWWYGMSSHLACGHAPSMQTPEMAHRQVKRALTDAPGRSLLTVLQSLKEAVSLWTSDRSMEQDSFTLLTPNGRTSVRPCRPDSWMLGNRRLWRHRVEVLWQSLQTKRLDAVRDLLGRSGAILEVEGGRNADLSIDRCLSLRMSPLSLCLPRQLLISLEFCRRSERANPRSIVDAWGCRNLFPKSWMLLLGSKASFCRRKCRFTPAFWGHAHEVDVIAPPLSGQDDEMPPPTAAPVREEHMQDGENDNHFAREAFYHLPSVAMWLIPRITQEDSTEDGPRKRMLESQDVVHVTVFAEGTDGLNELSFTVRQSGLGYFASAQTAPERYPATKWKVRGRQKAAKSKPKTPKPKAEGSDSETDDPDASCLPQAEEAPEVLQFGEASVALQQRQGLRPLAFDALQTSGAVPDGGKKRRNVAAAILKQQAASEQKPLCLSQTSFGNLCRDVAKDVQKQNRKSRKWLKREANIEENEHYCKLSTGALAVLQLSSEEMLASVMSDSARLCEHAKRQTVDQRDLSLAVSLRREWGDQLLRKRSRSPSVSSAESFEDSAEMKDRDSQKVFPDQRENFAEEGSEQSKGEVDSQGGGGPRDREDEKAQGSREERKTDGEQREAQGSREERKTDGEQGAAAKRGKPTESREKPKASLQSSAGHGKEKGAARGKCCGQEEAVE